MYCVYEVVICLINYYLNIDVLYIWSSDVPH